MAITQTDIVRILGISRTTVSRALSNHPRISRDVKDKVKALSIKLGYQGYITDDDRRRTISIITDHHRLSEISVRWISNLQECAKGYGYEFQLGVQNDYKRLIHEPTIAGFIFIGMPLWDITDFNSLPVVVTDCDGLPNRDNTINIDNEGGIRQGVTHLISLGHSKIVFLGYIKKLPLCCQRYLGYIRTLNDFGYVAPPEFTIEFDGWPGSVDDVYQKEDDLITAIKKGATGIVASDDIAAIAAIKMLRRNGYSVPDDVSVVGFDNIAMGRIWEPPLTTIDQNIELAAKAVIDTLMECINSGSTVPGQIVPTHLIVRETTALEKSNGRSLHA